jgi:ribosomal protein S18 acetylase RimI-like enzyme
MLLQFGALESRTAAINPISMRFGASFAALSASANKVGKSFRSVVTSDHGLVAHQWNMLAARTILAVNEANEPIGCVVGKIDEEEIGQADEVSERQIVDQENDDAVHEPVTTTLVGYIGMLAVSSDYRRRGIGKALVQRILRCMQRSGCTSATLETEVTNVTAMQLYQDIFGFIREELLVRYYLNWNDAYRLRLWFQ